MSYITAISTANPPNRFSQGQICEFMVKAMGLASDDARKLKTIFRASGIEWRYSALEDYGRTEGFTFFPNTPDFEPFPSTVQRLEVFKQYSLQLSVDAAAGIIDQGSISKDDITHLIIVSCTGMYAPGLDIDLVKALNLPSHVQRTCITFMGCYAAFNGLKAAHAFCQADEDAKVLLICTELCSLHFQKKPTEDNLLANALFGDGSAAVLVEGKTTKKKRLRLEKFFSDIAYGGEKDMAWNIGEFGFEMKLSSYVPEIIQQGIRKLTCNLLKSLALRLEEIEYFVMHPGGKKILQVVEKELSIPGEKNKQAYQVLREYGNMSSPTVLFVLKEVFSLLRGKDDQSSILSFAFGPGLTLESMLLKIEIEA